MDTYSFAEDQDDDVHTEPEIGCGHRLLDDIYTSRSIGEAINTAVRRFAQKKVRIALHRTSIARLSLTYDPR